MGSDEGYPEVFERQLEAFAQKGDVVFALSTSGNSEKVITGDSVSKTEGLLHDKRDREKRGEDSLEVELDTRGRALQGGQRRDVDRSGGDHDHRSLGSQTGRGGAFQGQRGEAARERLNSAQIETRKVSH